MIKEYRLKSTNPKLDDKMKFAQFLPYTEGPEDEGQLRQDLGL